MSFTPRLAGRPPATGSQSRGEKNRWVRPAGAVLAMALLAGGAAGCSSGATSAASAASPAATAPAPAASSAPASSAKATASAVPTLSGFDALCVDDAAPGGPAVPAAPDPAAPAYDKGDAPAPVYFDSSLGFDGLTEDDGGVLGGDYVYAKDGVLVASDDYTVPAAWTISAPSQAQLVACVTGNGTTSKSPQAAPCQYGLSGVVNQASVPVHKETYTITLYVARTGKILTSRTVTGSNADVCPSSVTTVNGKVQSLLDLVTILTIKDIASVIGKYASA